jgi:hypothetical protein
MEYKDVDGFFAPHRIQSHTFTETEDKASEFQVFLTMVSTGKDPRKESLDGADTDVLKSFYSMFGYLCHSYKNASFNPAIILSDDGANDVNRNGGRGKTIFANALQHVQPSIIKGGDEFNPSYIHNFADLRNDKRIYILDDVPAGFKYDALYTNIVGGISCQRKGTEAVEIPFSKAPKFLITTNWSVRYEEEEASTNRRFMEFKFTNFFNLNNTPFKVFGHSLFEDWDSREWNRFYNFVFYCVDLYHADGLNQIPYDKSKDNYRAVFNNDVVFAEFERVFKLVARDSTSFNVSDFLTVYNLFTNPLKNEKLFSSRNLKTLVDTYINEKDLNFKYVTCKRKWVRE